MASTAAAGNKLSREEFRRQKDLEAARKAGTAAPALDEEGKAINPHIPEFMSKAPWYLSTGDQPSLKHQKAPLYNADPNKLKERFDRGTKIGPAATKFRKGACPNCGAMTHKAKDCLERPRKKGAKYTGQDIAADEIIHNDNARLNGMEGQGDYDAKRDRWDGYDAANHVQVVQEYQALDEARRKLREEAIDKGDVSADAKEVKKAAKQSKAGKKRKQMQEDDDDFGSSDESEVGEGGDDEDKYAEGADVAGQRMDAKTRVTVRNLRIREDTAKYLRNLDIDSAYYDPKTRSMREAPVANIKPEDAVFAGDNFHRHSGQASEVQRLQLFAWQSEQRGNDVHINSNPTQSHLLHKEFLNKKEALKETSAASILGKYGGEEYLASVPKELLGGQTEEYVEYSRTGQIVKGIERAKAKSKYEEDIYPGNHTSIWGSWYDMVAGDWGFACCHQKLKKSYCAGKASIESAEFEGVALLANGKAEERSKTLVQLKVEAAAQAKRDSAPISDRQLNGDSTKNAGFSTNGVSEEEMDKYRKNREQRFDDPAAQFGRNSDELLPL